MFIFVYLSFWNAVLLSVCVCVCACVRACVCVCVYYIDREIDIYIDTDMYVCVEHSISPN